MIALILNGDRVVGYNEDISLVQQSSIDFILVPSIPSVFNEQKENQIIKVDAGGTLYLEDLPAPPVSEVDALKAKVDGLTEQLAVTNATVDFLLGI
jgi:hypothetical protein